MEFVVIMKQKTPVCQFASPLDVDLHSKPEAVVLEGKYWKRQFDVIKAEYMKWRKFYRNRGLGNNAILDTVSEVNFNRRGASAQIWELICSLIQ